MQKNTYSLTQDERKGLKRLTIIHLVLMQAMLFYLLIPQLIIDTKISKEINTDLGILLQIAAFIVNFIAVIYYRFGMKKLQNKLTLLADFTKLHLMCWLIFECCGALGIVYAISQNDPKGSLLFVLLGFGSIVAHPATRARYAMLKEQNLA